MKKFTFYHSHSSAILIVKAPTFNEADSLVDEMVKSANEWYVDDEDGDEE